MINLSFLSRALVSTITLVLFTSCHQPTTNENSGISIPPIGSIFIYADTGIVVNGSPISTQRDTVLGSETTFDGRSNVLAFSPSPPDLLNYKIVNFDNFGYTEAYSEGPPYIAFDSLGDISMPATLSIGGLGKKGDSTMQWITFPISSHKTLLFTNSLFDKDSIVVEPNVQIAVGGITLNCEHAVDYHIIWSDSGVVPPASEVDLYFSPSLGIPVLTTVRYGVPNKYSGVVYSKRLISYTN